MVNIGIGTAFISAILGYFVVFLGIFFLMLVIGIFGKAVKRSNVSVTTTNGVDPKKVAAIMAVISEIEKEA
ncbi:MAG: OadG family protein [Bacillota bacterium]|nr:OadG family protein [Bacillota bacterium]